MNKMEYIALIHKIDPVNAEYIIRCEEIMNNFARAEKYRSESKEALADSVIEGTIARIKKFGELVLTPANVKVGDGVTINLWSDRYAATIIKVTAKTVTVQRDKAILNPDFKPEWIPGGFAAHCTNQEEQRYTYERDENGRTYLFHWSNKYQRYGQPRDLNLSKGRHEFYDYNF